MMGEAADKIMAGLREMQIAERERCGAVIEVVSQALQDHMEQHNGICLTASQWDEAARVALKAREQAMTPTPTIQEDDNG